MQEKAPRLGAFKKRGRPKTKLSVTVFIDFLGFSEAIKRAHKKGEIDQLLYRITKFIRIWSKVLVDRYGWDNRRSWEVKFFTDNVVIGYPIHDLTHLDPEFGSVFGQLSLFQIGSVAEGFFVRGGIALGQLYMDENVVFGIPLIDAYKAESKVAQFPRIIFCESAISAILKRLGKREYIHRSPYYRDLLQDEDGRFFLNYLEASYVAGGEPPEYTWIEQHSNAVKDALCQFKKNPRIYKKYEWVARYHNFWCSSKGLCQYKIPNKLPLKVKRLDEIMP